MDERQSLSCWFDIVFSRDFFLLDFFIGGVCFPVCVVIEIFFLHHLLDGSCTLIWVAFRMWSFLWSLPSILERFNYLGLLN